MKSYSALIIIALLFFISLSPHTASAQCSQQIKVSDLRVDKQDQKGSFRLSVGSGTDYTGQLIKIDGTSEQTVESFGRGTRHQFSNLDVSGDAIYRVVLSFSGEERFLCRRKVVDVEFANLR
ncbi:MAG: hypothetical protein R2820_14305 [Cyclobacteriaceae bacterium]|nr:hypothetical protein [Cyclobacteriaceae bacterium]